MGIGHIGWHTFRHTFRSLLDETGAPLKVQQELMRHRRYSNNNEHLRKSHGEEQARGPRKSRSARAGLTSGLVPPYCPQEIYPLESKGVLVGAVGIELKATLKARKLLIPLNEKNGKNTEFTQVRYTAGTRKGPRDMAEIGAPILASMLP